MALLNGCDMEKLILHHICDSCSLIITKSVSVVVYAAVVPDLCQNMKYICTLSWILMSLMSSVIALMSYVLQANYNISDDYIEFRIYLNALTNRTFDT